MLKILLSLMYLIIVTYQNVVVTVQGRLRGVGHEGFLSYTGIPYASISESAGKFKRAGLAPLWLGIREATHPTCSSTSGVEECLQLDVHVPTTGSSWPVLVWVRGVSGQFYPGKLARTGILVVTVYHRMAPPGFICLNNEQIPGNAGLKDVIAALRWVRDNIVAFKGNPAKVVVAGHGFGAAMAEALTLAPIAQGLYHGVILQSGTVLSPMAFNYDAEIRATTLAGLINDGDDTTSVLLDTKLQDLAAKSQELDVPYYPFGICIEKVYNKEERVLLEAPYDLLFNNKANSVPMMIGYTSNEAYIFAYALKRAKVVKKISRDLSFLLPEELEFLNEREVATVARKVKDTYFRSNVTMAAVLAYYSDAYFISHIHRSVRFHSSSHQPVYFYQFSHPGSVGVEPEPGVHKTGAAHSDELAYLFYDKDFDGNDGVAQKHLLRLWSNFVKYLNPTPSEDDLVRWEAVDPNDPKVMNIGTELEMRAFPHKRAIGMWDDIYHKYYYGRHH